jgi:tol-pal system protein YbgF
MSVSLVRPLALGVYLALATATANAGLFEDDEARKAILDLRQRLEGVRLYAEGVNQKGETLRQSVELLQQNMDAVRQGINALRIGADNDRAELKQGGGRATEEVAILRRSLLELQNQIEQLRSEAAQMRGVNEQLLRELSDGQRRQKDNAQALDERFRATAQGFDERFRVTNQGLDERFRATTQGLDERLRATAQGLDERLRATALGMDERFRAVEPVKVNLDGREFMAEQAEKRDFEAALVLFRKPDFAAAKTAFFDFLSRYTRSGYAPSALFWLGNAQYATRDYTGAMVNFRALIANAPDHQRTPEAVLSVANCQLELKDVRGARKTLQDLVSAYPKSEAASAAKERLALLR